MAVSLLCNEVIVRTEDSGQVVHTQAHISLVTRQCNLVLVRGL